LKSQISDLKFEISHEIGKNGMGIRQVIGSALRRVARWADARSISIENPDSSIWDALRDGSSHGSNSGETVSAKSAMSIPAFYQAVSKISGDVAKLPLAVYRRRSDGGRELQRDHHAFKRVNLIGQANEEINGFKFWRRFMVQGLIYNNAYAWVDKNNRGEVLGIYNLLSDRTAPCRINGKLWFSTEVGGRLVKLEADEVLHVEGPSLDIFCGEHVVRLFRDLLGQSLAKRKFGSRFFKNGMTAGGVLAVPPGAKPETVRKLQGSLKEKYSNTDNAFKTLVLRDGYKWFSTQVDPQKAQMVEWTEQDAREIARMFNMKAGMLSVEGATSYNADEMAIRDYYDSTLSHWLIGIRSEGNAKLRTEAERETDSTYLDYITNALLWADAKTRSEIAATGIINGRFSPNETRAWENLNPYEGGDTFFQPLNVQPVGTPVGDAARSLAEQAIKRAENRLRIKLERCKTEVARAGVLGDAEELAAVREMIDPACVVLGINVDSQISNFRTQLAGT
jgi:HK97 family phage portal protein